MSSTKRWSTKKKIITGVFAVALVGVIVFVAYSLLKPDLGNPVPVTEVTRGDVTQTLDVTGTVESGNQGVFEILENAEVLDVNVRVGDTFKKGDVLATFKADSLDTIVAQKLNAYEAAKASYAEYLETAQSSGTKLAELDAQIAALEKSSGSSDTAEEKEEETKQYKTKIGEWIAGLFGTDEKKSATSSALSGLFTGSLDLSSMLGLNTSSDEMELMQLKLEKTLLETQSGETLATVYQTSMNSAEKNYNTVKTAVDKLKNGWIAEYDGIVRDVYITAGDVFTSSQSADTSTSIDLSSLLSGGSAEFDLTSLLSGLTKQTHTGMTVEYYPFVASFTLGKYDVLNVSMDQKVVVTSADGKTYDGVITYISPVATDGGGINISSLLSSSSGSSSGVAAKVSILNPDESIIIGFDVDIAIDTDSEENTLVVPIEALQYSSEASYVFIYDEVTKTVKKTEVETGIFTGTQYQILSGCEEGDVIVKSPALSLKDGEKILITRDENATVVTTTE